MSLPVPSLQVLTKPRSAASDDTASLGVYRSGTATARPRPTLGRLMLASDLLAATTAAAGTLLVLSIDPGIGTTGTGLTGGPAFAAASCAVLVAVLAARGAYSSARRTLTLGPTDDLFLLLGGVLLSGLVLLAATNLPPLSHHLPVGGIAVLTGAALATMPLFRAVALTLAARVGTMATRVIVVGSGRVASHVAERLAASPLVRVVGTVDDEPTGDLDVLGSVDELPTLCRAVRADRVVIAFSRRHPAQSAELVLALRDVVEVDVVARYFELAGWESRLHDVAGLSLLNLGRRPGRGSAAAKRALDVVVAALGLVLASPLLGVVALGILVSSGRPIFFRQRRVGREQRPFDIVKFRTMRPGSPVAPAHQRTVFDVPDLGRVTGVGRFLRRAALDELPQLWNVLAGQMSLVGPRPFVPEECHRLHGWAYRRFDVRPGLTGMWQVCGQHQVTFDELCRLDVQYATTWTLRTDLRILARTPSRLLHGSAPGR